jgi:phenylacetate-CoA ligase
MPFYNWISEKSLFIGDILLGSSMKKSFDFLMQSQWWSKEEIEEYHNQKLRQLVEHAYKNVPYYQNVFEQRKLKPDDIKTVKDLVKLPLLTKEIIRENFPHNMVAQNIPREKMIIGGSSGSTGQPLQYYKTKESLSMIRAANLRGWYWTNFRLGDPYMKIATMPRNRLSKKIQDWLNRSYYVHSRSIDQKDIDFILETIKRRNIKIVRGYPGSLFILATFLEEKGDNSFKLDTIITTSEPLYPYLREKIERVFHCKIFDSYGAEGAPIIFECPTHECYHISPEIAIVEYLKDGQVVSEGKASLVYTDITNYATPFIRYDIRDFAVPRNEPCSCGREMPSVTTLEGRETDVLITPSGKYITFYFFAGYFEHQNFIDLFQLAQNEIDKFTLYIVPNSNFKEEFIKKIKEDVLEVMGTDITLKIEVVDDIPLTSSGKRRFFVRNPQIKVML